MSDYYTSERKPCKHGVFGQSKCGGCVEEYLKAEKERKAIFASFTPPTEPMEQSHHSHHPMRTSDDYGRYVEGGK